MKSSKQYVRALMLACLLGSGTAYADDDLDVTMRMVPTDVDLPDAVTKVITLPPPAPDNARTNAEKGLSTANDARERSRDLDMDLPAIEIPKIEMPEQSRGRGRP